MPLTPLNAAAPKPKEGPKDRPVTDPFLTEFHKLHAVVEQSYANRSRRMFDVDESFRWRKGLVGRPLKHLPFPGSADIRFRLTESIIRKLKPAFVQSIIMADRIVRIIAQTGARVGSASKLEHFYNVFYRATFENFGEFLAVLVDRFLESGKVVVKITFDHRTEPQIISLKATQLQQLIEQLEQQKAQIVAQEKARGNPNTEGITTKLSDKELEGALMNVLSWDTNDPDKQVRIQSVVEQYRALDEEQLKDETVEFVIDRVAANHPVVTIIENIADLTVPETARTIAEADWVAHDFFYTEPQFLALKDRYNNVDEVLTQIKTAIMSQNVQSRTHENLVKLAHGISQSGELTGFIRVRELYCYLPANTLKNIPGVIGDTPVKAIVTYCPDALDLVEPLKIQPYPYEHGRWPFEEHAFNRSRFGYYFFEGVATLINPYEQEMNILRNAGINRTYQSMHTPIIVWDKSNIHLNLNRQPNQPLISKVQPQAAAMPLQLPNNSQDAQSQSERTQQWAEEIAGAGGLQNLGGPYLQPPTAAQVNATMAPSQAILQFELTLFHEFMSRVMRQVHWLFKQYVFDVHDNNYKQVVPNLNNPQEVFEVNSEDFHGDYIIRPGGSINPLDNPVLQAQRQVMFFQSILTNPLMAPFFNKYKALRQYAVKQLGFLDASDIMLSEKEAEQASQQFEQSMAQVAAAQQEQATQGKTSKTPAQLPNAATSSLGALNAGQ